MAGVCAHPPHGTIGGVSSAYVTLTAIGAARDLLDTIAGETADTMLAICKDPAVAIAAVATHWQHHDTTPPSPRPQPGPHTRIAVDSFNVETGPDGKTAAVWAIRSNGTIDDWFETVAHTFANIKWEMTWWYGDGAIGRAIIADGNLLVTEHDPHELLDSTQDPDEPDQIAHHASASKTFTTVVEQPF